MKIWNIAVSQREGGAKHLDLQIHGVIDGGWMDEQSTSTAEIAKALAEHPDAATIESQINSVGGSLFGGIALYNILQAHPAEVTSNIVGIAASAASIIGLAGKTVMHPGSMMMIHNPLAAPMGDAAALRRTAAVLDKARDGLVSIYQSKTGKDTTELKAMLDATTYFTPDQALRQGFANEIASGGDVTAEVIAGEVILNGVAFPTDVMPPQIFALATSKKTPAAPQNATPQGGQKGPEMAITREILAKDVPELLTALLNEGRAEGKKEGEAIGHAAGVAAERARLKNIDDLGLKGCDEMVAAAKYGDKPTDAPTLAVAAIKAGHQAGVDMLEARRRESEAAASVKQNNPAKSTEADEMEAAKNIAKYANRRRGGI